MERKDKEAIAQRAHRAIITEMLRTMEDNVFDPTPVNLSNFDNTCFNTYLAPKI